MEAAFSIRHFSFCALAQEFVWAMIRQLDCLQSLCAAFEPSLRYTGRPQIVSSCQRVKRWAMGQISSQLWFTSPLFYYVFPEGTVCK
jgi:hypothetical protein